MHKLCEWGEKEQLVAGTKNLDKVFLEIEHARVNQAHRIEST